MHAWWESLCLEYFQIKKIHITLIGTTNKMVHTNGQERHDNATWCHYTNKCLIIWEHVNLFKKKTKIQTTKWKWNNFKGKILTALNMLYKIHLLKLCKTIWWPITLMVWKIGHSINLVAFQNSSSIINIESIVTNI